MTINIPLSVIYSFRFCCGLKLLLEKLGMIGVSWRQGGSQSIADFIGDTKTNLTYGIYLGWGF